MNRVRVQMDERSHDQMNCARRPRKPKGSVPRRPSVRMLEERTLKLQIVIAFALLGFSAFWIAYGLGCLLGHLVWGWF